MWTASGPSYPENVVAGETLEVALKEWAVVAEALAAGRQSFLLRKGGIGEGKRGFEVRYREFLVFPTWEHQHAEAVRPEFQRWFQDSRPHDPAVVDFRYAVRITDVLPAPAAPEAFDALTDCHIYTPVFFRKRYEYRPEQPLFVLLAKLFRLPRPCVLPYERRYAGCHSWVTLEQEVPVADVQPAVTDEAFEVMRRRVLQGLAPSDRKSSG